MIYNFFKIPENVGKEPYLSRKWIKFVNSRSKIKFPPSDESMLRKISRRYILSHFIFDFLSSVPPLIILIVVKDADSSWIVFVELLLLLRITRIKQIIIPVKAALSCCIRQKKLRKAVIEGTDAVIYILIIIHFSTCAWIYVGLIRNDTKAKSWMYSEPSTLSPGYFRQ